MRTSKSVPRKVYPVKQPGNQPGGDNERYINSESGSKFLLAVAVLTILLGTACTHADGGFQKTFTVTATPDVEIDNGTGNITVRTGDVNSVQVTANIEVFALSPDFVVERIEKNPPLSQSGNRIRIGNKRDYSDPFRQVQIRYTVTVPASTRLVSSLGTGDQDISGIQGNLNVSNGTGNIRLSDCVGDARVDDGTGDIRADRATGTLKLETGTGTIQLINSKASRAEVSTGTGDIDLDSVEGQLQAHTGTGNITVAGLPTSSWRVSTGTGNISFRTTPTATYRIEAHGSIGRVNLGSGAQSVRNEEDHHSLFAEVGTGGPRVELTTGTGNIDIN